MARVSDLKRQETIAKIIATATELFSKYGYHNTQVMDIVRAVGISAGTFYNYFKDKRDLFEHITRDSFEDLRARIRALRHPLDVGDLNERKRTVAQTYTMLFDFVDRYPEIMLLIFRGGYGVDEAFDLTTWSWFSNVAHDLAEDVQDWIDEGIIAGLNPLLFGHAAAGISIQIIHSYIVDRKFTREEAIETMVTMHVAMFDAYLTDKGKTLLQLPTDDGSV